QVEIKPWTHFGKRKPKQTREETEAVKLRFQQQQVWSGQREQPYQQHDVGTGESVPTTHDFLREAQANAPFYTGMVIAIMLEVSSRPPNILKRSSKSWGRVAAVNKVLTNEGGVREPGTTAIG
ncbi:unnamed protein product, partial [Ectocarpus sp. 6 AP-2014]